MGAGDRTAVARLRAEFGQAISEWDRLTDAAKKNAKAQEEAARKADQSGQAVDRNKTLVGQASTALELHRSEWDQVGTSMMRSGALMVATTALVSRAAMSWESSWAGVLKTVDTDDPFKLAQIESGLRGLAKTMPESHQQIAATAEAAGQLGVAADDVVDFTRIMVMLGDTTNLSAEDAATGIAQLMNVMQTAPGDVDRLGATLVGLGNDGASTEAQILGMAERIAGAGEIIGLTEAQVLALSNALASSGIEVEAGGSAISNVLIDIDKAVSTNSKDLETWASTAGMTARDFAAAWEADPAQALVAFTTGLGDMAARGENAFGVLDELGQSDVRVTRALLNMANAGSLLADSFRNGDRLWAENSALTEEAAKRYDTTAAKAEIAWNNVKDNAIDAGQAMLPVISQISDAVVGVASAFGALPDGVQGTLTVLAGASGIMLLVAGGAMKMAASVSDSVVAWKTLQSSAPTIANGMSRVAKSVGIAAAAFATLQAAGAYFDSGGREGVATYTDAVLNLTSGAKGARKELDDLFTVEAPGSNIWGETYEDINGLNEALDAMNPGKYEEFRQSFQSFVGFETRVDAATKSFTQLDSALVSLVDSGAGDRAAQMFDIVAEEAEKKGLKISEVRDLLPTYTDKLKDLEVQERLSAEQSEAAAEQMSALDMVLAELGGGEEAQKKLDALNESTRTAAMSFLDAAMAIDPAKDSLSSWINRLEEAAEAQAKWADNMVQAKIRGVDEGVLQAIQEQGPAAAGILDELANGSEKDIERINKAFGRGEQTAGDFASVMNEIPDSVFTEFATAGTEGSISKAAAVASKYGLVPEDVETILRAQNWAEADIKAVLARLAELNRRKQVKAEITAATGQAQSAIDGVLASLGMLRSKTITVDVIAKRGGNGWNIPQADGSVMSFYAGGGMNDPKSENHVAQIAPAGAWRVWAEPETGGEAYIPLAPAKRGRSMEIWRQTGRLLGATDVDFYARGGLRTSDQWEDLDDDRASGLDLVRMQQRIRDLQRDLRKRGKKALRGLDRRAAQLELREVLAELAAARRANAEQRRLRRRGSSIAREAEKARKREDAAEDAKRAREDAAEERERARQEARDALQRARDQRRTDVASASSSFAGNADISTFSSPERVSRNLERSIADMSTFLGLLIDLKGKGAAPWLLQQLQAEGPTRGAIRFAQRLLTDSTRLNRLNAQAAQLQQVSNAYGAITSGWNSMTPAAGFAVGSTTKVDVAVTSLDTNRLHSDLARLVRQELAVLMSGSG